MDSVVVSSRDTHLPAELVDSLNYKVGRRMDWNGIHGSSADTNVEVDTTAAFVEIPEELVGEESPAWMAGMQQNAETYQSARTNKAKRNSDRLSGYSQTELSIANSMGLSPWDIDREQLRIWAEETDSVPPPP
jgi:hypothetical protein